MPSHPVKFQQCSWRSNKCLSKGSWHSKEIPFKLIAKTTTSENNTHEFARHLDESKQNKQKKFMNFWIWSGTKVGRASGKREKQLHPGKKTFVNLVDLAFNELYGTSAKQRCPCKNFVGTSENETSNVHPYITLYYITSHHITLHTYIQTYTHTRHT